MYNYQLIENYDMCNLYNNFFIWIKSIKEFSGSKKNRKYWDFRIIFKDEFAN